MSTILRSTSWPKHVAAASAVLVIALGAAVLAGWFFGVPTLIQIRPHLPPMTGDAAACFALSGLALLSLVVDGPRRLVASPRR